MNKKFRYKAVLYSYNEDDRDYNLFSEKKDYDNLLKIRRIEKNRTAESFSDWIMKLN